MQIDTDLEWSHEYDLHVTTSHEYIHVNQECLSSGIPCEWQCPCIANQLDLIPRSTIALIYIARLVHCVKLVGQLNNYLWQDKLVCPPAFK